MEFKENLMLKTKELMNNSLEKFREAFELINELQNNPEYLKSTTNTVDTNEEEYEKEDEVRNRRSGSCHCRPSYPCDCRKCDELFSIANRNLDLSIYAFNQAFETARLALQQLEDSEDYFSDAIEDFIRAIRCSNKHNCDDFCRSCRKNEDWHYTTCICKD